MKTEKRIDYLKKQLQLYKDHNRPSHVKDIEQRIAKLRNGEKGNTMKENDKKHLIAIREQQRALLQLKNLTTTMRILKEDIEKTQGLGLSLPAVESVAGKLGTAARAYQTATFTKEKEYNMSKTDQDLTEEEIRNQVQEIISEIREEPYDLQHRLEDRKPEKYPDQETHETYQREAKDIDQETKEIEDIEKELGKDDQTKIW